MTEVFLENKKITEIIRRQVLEVFREILSDPDFNLELRPEAIQRLKESIRSRESGKYTSLDKILEKHLH